MNPLKIISNLINNTSYLPTLNQNCDMQYSSLFQHHNGIREHTVKESAKLSAYHNATITHSLSRSCCSLDFTWTDGVWRTCTYNIRVSEKNPIEKPQNIDNFRPSEYWHGVDGPWYV
jgi:hypothetical protein